MKHRIGIIVQRYGSMINGGAEVHARMIAETGYFSTHSVITRAI